MDGKGRWVDNVFVERLWRNVRYEEMYLHACESVAAARAGLGRYFRFYNTERRHQSLGRRTPNAVYGVGPSWWTPDPLGVSAMPNSRPPYSSGGCG